MNITNNTFHQQNNVININLKIIKPFDDDWDVSNIDNTLKNILVLSSMKYTKTLEQLLNNDTNLNVFIDDKNAETGIVYNNLVADVDGDGVIGVAEALYIMDHLAIE